MSTKYFKKLPSNAFTLCRQRSIQVVFYAGSLKVSARLLYVPKIQSFMLLYAAPYILILSGEVGSIPPASPPHPSAALPGSIPPPPLVAAPRP
jgi:hypothetical protein